MVKIKKEKCTFISVTTSLKRSIWIRLIGCLGKKTEKYSIYTKSLNPSYMRSIPSRRFLPSWAASLPLAARPSGHILVKIYDFGAVTLRFGVDFDGDLNDLLKFRLQHRKGKSVQQRSGRDHPEDKDGDPGHLDESGRKRINRRLIPSLL